MLYHQLMHWSLPQNCLSNKCYLFLFCVIPSKALGKLCDRNMHSKIICDKLIKMKCIPIYIHFIFFNTIAFYQVDLSLNILKNSIISQNFMLQILKIEPKVFWFITGDIYCAVTYQQMLTYCRRSHVSSVAIRSL